MMDQFCGWHNHHDIVNPWESCVCSNTNESDFRLGTKWQDTAPPVTSCCRFVLALKLLCEERSQIMRDASNKLLNIHNIYIDSQCNDGYPGSCWIFLVKYQKDLFLNIRPWHYMWELNSCCSRKNKAILGIGMWRKYSNSMVNYGMACIQGDVKWLQTPAELL